MMIRSLSLAVCTLLLVGCSAPPQQGAVGKSAPAAKVRFMVANPVINLGHTHLAALQQKGYGKEANVDVEYLTSDGTVAVVQALATDSADMGQTDTLAIDAAVTQGVDEVMAVCSYVANNIYYLVVREDSPIEQISQLKGKKIAVSSLGTGVFFNARVMAEDAGLKPETDIEFVTIAQPGAQLDALVKGTVDALSIIDVTIATFENQGVKLRKFQPTGPMQWQWNVVAARKSFLDRNPDAVAGACKAIQQAEVYVQTSPKAALKQFRDWGGDVGTTPEEQSINIIKFRADAGFRTYPEGNNRWGWMNVDKMDELADLYFKLGLVKAQTSVKKAYTLDLIDRIQPDVQRARSEAEKDAG